MSDVCKHCSNAGCLDACPTGALIRTEFETVVLQADVCNGCGYCVPSCPFGVVDRDPFDGRAAKCTLCYDRLEDGLEPACAKACPTDSIQFGPYDELVETAKGHVVELHEQRGRERLPLRRRRRDRPEQLAGGLGAFFLLTEPPERFGLPAQADSPIQENAPVGHRRRGRRRVRRGGRDSRTSSSPTGGPRGESLRQAPARGAHPARAARPHDARDITPPSAGAASRAVPACVRGGEGGARQAALG